MGTLLFILYFCPATLANQAQLAQRESGSPEAAVDCRLERKDSAENRINALVIYTMNLNEQSKEKALESLVEAFKLMPTLKNVQARAHWVNFIVVAPDGDTTLLEKIAALYFEAGSGEQLSPLLSQVLPVVQSLSTGYSSIKTDGLTAIARHYALIGQQQKALEILSQSLQSAKSLQGAQFKTLALTKIAETYILAGKLEPVPAILAEAVQFANAYQSPNAYTKGYAISPIAVAYAKIGQYDRAIEVARSIVNAPPVKASALAAIASEYARKGQLEQALQLAQSLEEAGGNKPKVLSDIAVAYIKAGQQDKAFEVFSQAVQLARSVAGDTGVTGIVTQYAEAGQLDAALKVAQSLEGAEGKANALAALTFLYLKAGQEAQASQLLSQAIALVPAIPEAFNRRSLLQGTIENSVKAGRFDYALQVAQTIEGDSSEFDKRDTLVKLAIRAAQAGKFEQALQIVQALDKSELDWRNTALRQIALAYAAAGQYDNAISVAQTLENYGSSYTFQSRTLAAIANALLKSGQTNRAIELYARATQVADSLEFTAGIKAQALAAVALEYGISGQQDKASELLARALQVAQSEKDAGSLSSTLQTIANESMRAQQYDLALQVVRLMPEASNRMQSLPEITDKFLEAGQYDKALQVVSATDVPSEQAKLLVAIASSYVQNGQLDKATEILARALQVARTIEGLESREIVVKAESDGQGNVISQLKADDDSDRGSLLELVALGYAEAGEYNPALQIVQSLEDTNRRNQLIQRLACYR